MSLPRGPSRVFFLLSLPLLLALLASNAVATPVGTFIQVEGTVEVLGQGKPPAVPAKVRDRVAKGDLVRTKSQSRAQLRFVDESVLTLSPSSSVLIEDYLYDPQRSYRQAALNLFRGLAYTVVNRILQTEEPDFVVKTHTAVLGVRGTRFFTLVGARFTGGYIEQGEVEMVARVLPTSKALLRRMEFAVAPIGRVLVRGRLSSADLNLLRRWLVTGVPQRVLTGDPPFLSLLGPPGSQMPSLDMPKDIGDGMFVPPTVVPQIPTTPAPTPAPTPHQHQHPYP
jgi:hypothetical protein